MGAVNIKTFLFANTEATLGKEVPTLMEFMKAQGEINHPMLLFMNKDNNELILAFNISANSKTALDVMIQYKYFDTPDLPPGVDETHFGYTFVGVYPNKSEGKAAV